MPLLVPSNTKNFKRDFNVLIKISRYLINKSFEILKITLLNIIGLFAKVLLFMTGWKPPSQGDYKLLQKHRKLILCFSHTSNWDFIIAFIYILAYPGLFRNVKIVVKPQLFEFGATRWLFTLLDCIPATKMENKNNSPSKDGTGFIAKTINKYRNIDTYCISISPKGKRDINSWSSGYYYLAKGLKIPITVVGLDYIYKELILEKDVIENIDQKSLEDVQLLTQYYIGQIIPLYPNCTPVMLKYHDKDLISVVDYNRLIIFLQYLSLSYICSAIYMKIFLILFSLLPKKNPDFDLWFPKFFFEIFTRIVLEQVKFNMIPIIVILVVLVNIYMMYSTRKSSRIRRNTAIIVSLLQCSYLIY